MRRSSVLAVSLVAASCGGEPASGTDAPSRLGPASEPATLPATVALRGIVFDRDRRQPVPDVEVVIAGAHGEATTRTRGDGSFELRVPRGQHRAFVRAADVMTIGAMRHERLRRQPDAALVNAVDELLTPRIDLDDDASGVELGVSAAAHVRGVLAHGPTWVSGAIVHAHALDAPPATTRSTAASPLPRSAPPRPAIGTDTAVSGPRGEFALSVPPGRYALTIEHPQFAGLAENPVLDLAARDTTSAVYALRRGCSISGRVIVAGGAPPVDGAIETRMEDDRAFRPTGHIAADGTFRWSTTDEGSVSLRAWPWRSPPTSSRTFACRDGARFGGVALTVGDDPPALSGTLVDARGQAVPLAYLDVEALDADVSSQQERSDAAGSWQVYDLPAGRYRLTAYAPGRGVARMVTMAPHAEVRLQLRGVGRLAGTTADLIDGSFELTLHRCGPAADPIELAEDPRIVIVRGGRFVVERVPACTVTFTARWRDRVLAHSAVVEADLTTHVDLAVGQGTEKSVQGTVRDRDGSPVRDVRVTALIDNREAATVRTDESGRYTLTTRAGAQLVAGHRDRVGRGTVGRANVLSERVDLVIE